mmetsp:Transcript_54380/g.137347  ORF Transcript_54380/g.137347 Transcript_54380/m.137347 type:complete len:112 (+) Transcript_54380:888-1223(+)
MAKRPSIMLPSTRASASEVGSTAVPWASIGGCDIDLAERASTGGRCLDFSSMYVMHTGVLPKTINPNILHRCARASSPCRHRLRVFRSSTCRTSTELALGSTSPRLLGLCS